MVNLFIEKSLWMSSFDMFKRLFMIWNLKNSFSYQVKILLFSVDFNLWSNLDSKAICHVMQTFPNQVLTNESSPESRPDFGLEFRDLTQDLEKVKTCIKSYFEIKFHLSLDSGLDFIEVLSHVLTQNKRLKSRLGWLMVSGTIIKRKSGSIWADRYSIYGWYRWAP